MSICTYVHTYTQTLRGVTHNTGTLVLFFTRMHRFEQNNNNNNIHSVHLEELVNVNFCFVFFW